MSQTDRVLAALTRAGEKGITQVDFIRYPTADGGPSILRVAARVGELRDAGFNIVTVGERDGCAVYRLLPRAVEATQDAGGSEAAQPPVSPPASGQLFPVSFDEAVPPRRPAIYDDDEAA